MKNHLRGTVNVWHVGRGEWCSNREHNVQAVPLENNLTDLNWPELLYIFTLPWGEKCALQTEFKVKTHDQSAENKWTNKSEECLNLIPEFNISSAQRTCWLPAFMCDLNWAVMISVSDKSLLFFSLLIGRRNVKYVRSPEGKHQWNSNVLL